MVYSHRFRRLRLLVGIALFVNTIVLSSRDAVAAQPRFRSTRVCLPPHWTGSRFQLSQDYPRTYDPHAYYPWQQIDFHKNPEQYLRTVLAYCRNGNPDLFNLSDENGTGNYQNRTWYHAPWLDYGPHGREPIHGLTYERVADPGNIDAAQKVPEQDWAVSLYNAPGGYTIGRVWSDSNRPNPDVANFPEGTVSVKLLFTEATLDQVPFLKGAKTWCAYIYEKPLDTPGTPSAPTPRRVVRRMRLLQIDVAVKDYRASRGTGTGWVFGTFCYSADAPGNDWYARMVPVGLMWGNRMSFEAGVGESETKLTPSRYLPCQHLGWQRRLNGPVDNPISSCVSCHSTAETPENSTIVPSTPDWQRWFRSLPCASLRQLATSFDPGCHSFDYSLQLSTGFQNWKLANTPVSEIQRSRLLMQMPGHSHDTHEYWINQSKIPVILW